MSAAENYYKIIAAQNAANKINENTANFAADAAKYKGERNITLGKLESLSGTATKDLSKQFRDYFNKIMSDATSKFSTALSNYTPGLLGSTSYKGSMAEIGGQMQNYSTAVMKDMGSVNSALATAADASSTRVGNQAINYANAAGSTATTGLTNLSSLSASNIGNLQNTTAAGASLLTGTGRSGSAKLYGALSAPIAAFQKIQGDQAFSNLYNPYLMRIASAPSLQRSDVGSMRDLYKYNV